MGFFLLLSKSSKLIILNCQSVLNSVSVKLTLCYFTHVSYISLEKNLLQLPTKPEFWYLILYHHICIWSYISKIAALLLMVELCPWVIDNMPCEAQRMHFSVNMIEVHFQFYVIDWNLILLGEINVRFAENAK